MEARLLVVAGQQRLAAALAAAVRDKPPRLYVRIDAPGQVQEILPRVYLEASKVCADVDVRVLLGPTTKKFVTVEGDSQSVPAALPEPRYERVVLGGTFDRLHNGHKVLLSRALLLARSHITCGVTDKEMIHRKLLWELIQPVSERIAAVEEFVRDVGGGRVRCVGEPIRDPFGPSIEDASLECIVVSQETLKGGHAVNTKRQERGMSVLDVDVIEILDGKDEVLNETKISSSTGRRRLLGTLLRPPRLTPDRPETPYIIGLTGGIACGKSNIAKQLKTEGFEVIDCDKLGHSIYEVDADLVKEIEETWPGCVHEGKVDRKALGKIVFADKTNRLKLNALVWPCIEKQVNELVSKSKSNVIFVEAAAIIEAGWHLKFRELWTVMVKEEVAVQRVVERDSVSQTEAEQRLRSQLSNAERVAQSHVVFCSEWAFEETRSQVLKAIANLRLRLPPPSPRSR